MNTFSYARRISAVVPVGEMMLGGTFPVRVQSMTNTPTLDTKATVEQCIRTIHMGAEMMRITTPAQRDAENLVHIRKALHQAGYRQPLVADVHFNPQVAEIAARIVEKVRINPGNYVDKKKFEHLEYTEEEYRLEVERIHERVLPLLKICKEYGTAIRIGVNHGSLSDRIISRYGDTPEGMVESAMEFLRIFESEGFYHTVISMKSSNTRVMTYSTRMLVRTMMQEGMNYPVHLGVTEAGEGEDGIIKSAVGIGTLLADGIGETIRVSLTGDPEQEIPVAREIVDYFANRPDPSLPLWEDYGFAVDYRRRNSKEKDKVGGNLSPKVVISPRAPQPDGGKMPTLAPEDMLLDENHLPASFQIICPENNGLLGNAQGAVLVLKSDHSHFSGSIRSAIASLGGSVGDAPVIVRKDYAESDYRKLQIKAACDFGPLLIDGLADGIWIESEGRIVGSDDLYALGLNLLQASRLRMSKTEYISCPSCGRTLFDLSATTARIRERTAHLKHLKIGIMGCIVNGPGEMADADYGYVGSGPNRITLYKNKEVIKRNIPEASAVDELIALIRECGDWVEP